MTDEQAVRDALVRLSQCYVVETERSYTIAAQALALLDAKDAEIASLRAYITEAEGYDTALSRAEQAEAALAEERKAHQAFREEVSEAIYADKPAVDPLVAVFQETSGADCREGEIWAEAMARTFRAAIERAGGTISFEGDG